MLFFKYARSRIQEMIYGLIIELDYRLFIQHNFMRSMFLVNLNHNVSILEPQEKREIEPLVMLCVGIDLWIAGIVATKLLFCICRRKSNDFCCLVRFSMTDLNSSTLYRWISEKIPFWHQKKNEKWSHLLMYGIDFSISGIVARATSLSIVKMLDVTKFGHCTNPECFFGGTPKLERFYEQIKKINDSVENLMILEHKNPDARKAEKCQANLKKSREITDILENFAKTNQNRLPDKMVILRLGNVEMRWRFLCEIEKIRKKSPNKRILLCK
ncbi:unnamed protein product [Caenorhabditis angaria]|uniref:Uncharacterized protein n=1 Tax=Caenorhabditis angaria TaxID=860376 RepID=A0A9P1ITK8_9PELO|nr:unnamed protein product [Caenorhabditis angaria]